MISKNLFRSSLILAVILSLAACSSLQLPWNAGSASSSGSGVSGGGLSTDTKLASGILKLEKTDLAVKPEQARQLVFLWKAARTLASSDTTSTQEMAALYRQIKETLTAEQAAAIDQMNLTSEDVTALVKELSTQVAAVPAGQANPQAQQQRSASGATSTTRAQGQGGFPGGIPGGMMPGEFGGGVPGGMGASGSTTKTGATTGQAAGSRANQLGNSQVVNILILILSQRAGS
jgi:hypothetical protein